VTVIIYGNSRESLMRSAESLRVHYDCLGVIPEWRRGNKLRKNHLHWTTENCKDLIKALINVKVIPYYYFAEGLV
jgi:hypothetical protein